MLVEPIKPKKSPSLIKSIFYARRQELRLFLAHYPTIYFPSRNWLYGFIDSRMIARDTQIVIEGFPCSANSFAVKAFQMAQTEAIKIADHLHDPAQVIAAVHSNIPSIVLLRHPEDAVLSFIIRFVPNFRDNTTQFLARELNKYLSFYNPLTPYIDRFVIAEFSTVTNDFGSIIERANHQFNTKFNNFVHNDENVKKCFTQIEQFNRKRVGNGNKVSEKSVARPSQYRKQLKQELRHHFQLPELEQLSHQANQVYHLFKNSA